MCSFYKVQVIVYPVSAKGVIGISTV
jgi:hypothetical protein